MRRDRGPDHGDGPLGPLIAYCLACQVARVERTHQQIHGRVDIGAGSGFILRYARLSNGEYLAKGKTAMGFANCEEDFADNAVWSMNLLSREKHLMPWRIEDELKKIGANYAQAGLWRAFAVRDGHLITGQQNFSGAVTARKVIEALGR